MDGSCVFFDIFRRKKSCVPSSVISARPSPRRICAPALTRPFPAARTIRACCISARRRSASTAWPLWACTRRGCSRSRGMEARSCATARSTASGPSASGSSLRARRSRASPTVRSCSRSTSARGWTCSADWMRSLPWSSMMPGAAASSRRATPSASARCTTAMTPRARSSLPARRKTSSASCTM